MNDFSRPNADELLAGIQKAQHRTNRGKLKIFFGMCPGVGKTYSMLRAAQEKKTSGVRVVVGLVETHQRKETEKLVEGLELLPRRRVEYRDALFEEFDLDRALELKPELILVDELAHSNAPGSRHPKRYQDVKDLLVAGIDVYTTMNVQHIESRADLVFQIAGVPIRETVPDAFLEFADQIELIDLAPEDLIRRLKDGKVYLGDRADRAAENFFKEEKLTALRELALRFTAEIVDDHLRDHMQTKRILGPWNTNERLMVAISHSPFSARLLRSTRRMAYNLEAPWVALYVDTGHELAPADHEMLTKNLNLARELGAEVVTTKDRDVPAALNRIAGERNVTQIVMGRPDRRFFRDLFRAGNILNHLVNETSEVDIHIIRQKRKPVYRGLRLKLPRPSSPVAVYVKTLLFICALSAAIYPFRQYLGYQTLGFAFLMGILPISTVAGLGATLFGAALSAMIWDFFFIPPQFTFSIREAEDLMMILAYFAVAAVAGFLASRIKRQASDLLVRERRANVLYAFGRKLAEAGSDSEIATFTAESLAAVLPSSVAVFRILPDGTLSRKPLNSPFESPLNSKPREITEKDLALAAWSYTNQKKSGWRTDTLNSSPCLCIPLRGRSGVIGVLLIYPSEERSLSLDQENLIETISGHLATALEHDILETASRKAEIYEKSEKLHQALLNSVSHELRTPLTAILGSATALKDRASTPGPELREKLLDDVIDSSERLNHTVENLLDMSRISSGVLKLDEHVMELNDFLRSAAQRRPAQTLSHPIVLELSDEDLFIKGDEKILEHVLHNLLTNAARYSPDQTPIILRSRRNQSYAEFSVVDEGKGLPPGQEIRVFEKFYRVPGSPPGGVGLGLSITKAIVESHGGAIFAANRSDRAGALFTVILPSQTVPKEVFE